MVRPAMPVVASKPAIPRTCLLCACRGTCDCLLATPPLVRPPTWLPAPTLRAAGVVTLWDVDTRSVVQEYEAHARRIWSVDSCEADPTLLASGSDDCSVKLWSTQVCSAVMALVLAD